MSIEAVWIATVTFVLIGLLTWVERLTVRVKALETKSGQPKSKETQP